MSKRRRVRLFLEPNDKEDSALLIRAIAEAFENDDLDIVLPVGSGKAKGIEVKSEVTEAIEQEAIDEVNLALEVNAEETKSGKNKAMLTLAFHTLKMFVLDLFKKAVIPTVYTAVKVWIKKKAGLE